MTMTMTIQDGKCIAQTDVDLSASLPVRRFASSPYPGTQYFTYTLLATYMYLHIGCSRKTALRFGIPKFF